jgi:DNA (cytosine-5)-methyltransferase 1
MQNLPENLKLNVKVAHISQIYKRLHPDSQPIMILVAEGAEPIYITGEAACLTNRERARLQTSLKVLFFTGQKKVFVTIGRLFLQKEHKLFLRQF